MTENVTAKIYDLAVPEMTVDGALSQDIQMRTLESILKGQEHKETLPPGKIFTYSLLKQIREDSEMRGWRPKP